MKRLLVVIRRLLIDRLSLDDDKADEAEIIASIKRNVEFRGSSLWTLIFAIFIASIGLNVNSAAVVIGAMLISPLMGPIMGIGLGIGINDLELVRNGLKNLVIAASFSVATSTLYFWLTPLHEAQSEILARTTPSIWDVFIAFVGGLAGIVAGTRKEKSNVIPGVAIATALMPPLCTAGFGLANGNMYFFLGAFYLFFINCVFICISTFLIVRFLKFHKKEFENKAIEKRVSRMILFVVVATTLPSIYLAYRIVDQSIFESNARKLISNEFKFARTQVITQSFNVQDGKKSINVLLIGEELPDHVLNSIRARLPDYNLAGADLIIRQGLNAKQEIDFSAIKASILQDVFKQTDSANMDTPSNNEITNAELLALYPEIKYYSFSNAVFYDADTTQKDTVLVAVLKLRSDTSKINREQLAMWLKARLSTDSVKLLFE